MAVTEALNISENTISLKNAPPPGNCFLASGYAAMEAKTTLPAVPAAVMTNEWKM